MANRNFASGGKIYSMHVMPVLLDCNILIGATGAVSAVKGPGIASVTRLAVGTYQIQLQDNYSLCYGVSTDLQSPVSGSNVNDGSFTVGKLYQITAVGTTNWAAAGLPSAVIPAVGNAFVATTVGGAGTGTAKLVANSGISSIELAGLPALGPNPAPLLGGIFIIQCLGATSSSVTTQIPTDPIAGSTIFVDIYLSNSSVQVQGE